MQGSRVSRPGIHRTSKETPHYGKTYLCWGEPRRTGDVCNERLGQRKAVAGRRSLQSRISHRCCRSYGCRTTCQSYEALCLHENKPGAEGLLAAREVIKSNPSGDVLLFSTNTAITGINTFNEKPSFDPLVDLTPIARLGELAFLLVSHPRLSFASTQDFVRHAQAHPGALAYASGSFSSLLGKVCTTPAAASLAQSLDDGINAFFKTSH